MSQQYSINFIKKEKIALDAYAFFFTRPKDLDFAPGQFLRITLNIPSPDERGSSRFFSISSSPTENEYIMIAVRIVQSTFKKALYSLKQEDGVKITAPFGKFIFNENDKSHHVFLAGGIGITPFRSMVRFATDKNLQIPITLFTSFKTHQDALFQKELQEMARINRHFKFIQTITQPEESKTAWIGITGRIDGALLRSSILNLPSSIFYVCGPPDLVIGLTAVVKSLGVSDDRILTERFTGY